MNPDEQAVYAKGVSDVLAIIAAAAEQLEGGDIPLPGQELAIETLRAIAEEARALL